jgi:hypothetical protein
MQEQETLLQKTDQENLQINEALSFEKHRSVYSKNREDVKKEIYDLKLKISKTTEDYNNIREKLELSRDEDLPSLKFSKNKLISLEKYLNEDVLESSDIVKIKLENGEEFEVNFLDPNDRDYQDAEIAVKYLFQDEKKTIPLEEKNTNFYLENYTDFEKTKKFLNEKGLEVLSGRERLSQGISGIFFRLKVRDIMNNQEKYIVEKIGTAGDLISSRFKIMDLPQKGEEPGSFFRFKILDKKNNKEHFVNDTTYSQTKALKDLQGLSGVPEYYGSVFDGAKGSILEEFVDGEDMQMFFYDESKSSINERIEILEKFKKVYEDAAKKGYVYVYSDPLSATNMLSKDTKDPYLTDWYLYDYGDITQDHELERKFKYGLDKINERMQEELSKN